MRRRSSRFPIVGTFVGRDKTKNVPDNFREFRRVWPRLVDHAESTRRQDRDRELPDDLLLGRVARRHQSRLHRPPPGTRCSRSSTARASGSTSTRRISSGSRSTTSGSCATTREKVMHVHAKDLEIDRDGLYRNGTISLGMGWQVPRLPGLGEVRWDRFVAAFTGPATTTSSRSSTRIATSRRPRISSSADSSSPETRSAHFCTEAWSARGVSGTGNPKVGSGLSLTAPPNRRLSSESARLFGERHP